MCKSCFTPNIVMLVAEQVENSQHKLCTKLCTKAQIHACCHISKCVSACYYQQWYKDCGLRKIHDVWLVYVVELPKVHPPSL